MRSARLWRQNTEVIDEDRLLCSAVIRELEILGEAATKVSQTIQERFSNIPWRQVIGMRNRLIHAYFDVDHDVIWKTIHEALPALQIQLEVVIRDLESTSKNLSKETQDR